LLSPLPVLAYRLSEIFLIFSVFIFPCILVFFKNRVVGGFFVGCYCLVSFFYINYYLEYFRV
jgi:general stress protein CsbA